MKAGGNNFTGILLSGGKSCRMGQDKGLCMLGDKPMAAYGLELLETFCDEVLISANGDEYLQFGKPVIKDEIKNTGPIGGLYSAIKAAKHEDILVLSCDMPFVNEALFRHIIAQSNHCLAAIPADGDLLEPTCGYYNKKILPFIEEQIRKQKYSLRHLLEKAGYKKITLSAGMPFDTRHLFFNVNSPGDLQKAGKIILPYEK